MNERVYKTMKLTGAGSIALGIISIVVGLSVGVCSIISGVSLIRRKSELTF